MVRKATRGSFSILAGGPVVLAKDSALGTTGVDANSPELRLARRAAAVIKASLSAAHDLLNTKYSAAAKLAPPHLVGPTRALVVSCADGIIVRYEPSTTGADEVIAARLPASQTLRDFSPALSEQVLFCLANEDGEPSLANSPRVILGTVDSVTGAQQSFIGAAIGLKFNLESLKDEGFSLATPVRVLAIERDFDVAILGEMLNTVSGELDRRFVVRAPVALKVGWQRLELYPLSSLARWRVGEATARAEADILEHVMRRQLKADAYRALDPNVGARSQMSALLRDYESLLGTEPPEEDLQRFLKANPALLSPTHVDVWPKLAIGPHVTDFVFRQADGEYMLVELERSSHQLFGRKGATTAALNHARDQVSDWKRYIADNLRTVQNELGLADMSSNPQGLVVIGRSRSLSDATRRKLSAMNDEHPRLKIVTFDNVLANAQAVIENVVGTLWASTPGVEVFLLPKGADFPQFDALTATPMLPS